jgi:pimeloyl-ACP methyl ester carboxylesterase
MTRSLLNARIAAALALAVTMTALVVHADVVILKDGYTLHGLKTVKEKGVIIDELTGEVLIAAKANGMTAIDDGPRWVVFPNSSQQVADASENNRFKEFTAYTRERNAGTEKLFSTARAPEVVNDWDPKEWTRVVKFNDIDPKVKHTVKQHINFISPHYLRIGSSTHALTRYFLLHEFKPYFIRSLLVNHPDLIEKDGKPDAGKRERLIRFWIQADWLEEADKDLERLLVDLPAEKERHSRLKSEVNGLRAEKLMVEIERARDSGRHQWAIEALKAFPKDDVPRAVSVKVTTMRADYDKRTAQFAAAKGYLDDLIKKIPANNQFLIDGAAAVRNEVHLDTLSRLDMFITLAERAEKDVKEGRRPSHSPEDLISSAITGWHLGKVAAETKVATAYKCWTTRLMAMEYLRTPSGATRQKILAAYMGGPNALAYDELEKLVSFLPPPDAPEKLPKEMVTLNLTPSVAFPSGASYLLRLPDEYQHGRSYPLLIALPDPLLDKTPENLLARLGDLPNRLGYIVAVPQWWDPLVSTYDYSKEEQAIVLQLIRQLRRSYQVDSDRIYLWGNGEGASMALDLGGSHPDLFAGIVPVNPSVYQPLYIPAQYWVNFEKLPVYLIMGDKFGGSVNAIRMLSERWMPRGFPTLVVSYKGRGLEWFSEELPYAFDWMGRKRRADPGKRVGPPQYERTEQAGFSSVRVSDNRFHWLSTPEIKADRAMNPMKGSRATTPAKFSAKIIEGNAIEAKAFGMRELTVWFGRGMLDYSKPVRVKVNDGKSVTKQISPQIPVLMEDLYERADRQRPYFERIDMKVPG